tara:strand:- start:138 stop:407 length:270 start_codon:yes stop_codon:yes gene_type:complete
MDLDGRSKVNMPKARLVHMDHIRKVRDAELVKESGSQDRLPPKLETLLTPERQARLQILRDISQTVVLGKYRTPVTLKAAWPPELPGSA